MDSEAPDTAPRTSWRWNLIRFLGAAGLLYVLVYGSDVAVTARPGPLLGLRPAPVGPQVRPGRPWAYVPVATDAGTQPVTAEGGEVLFESHAEEADLKNNDLYRRIRELRKRLRIQVDAVETQGTAAAPLRALVPWMGAELQWDGTTRATVYGDEGVAVLTVGETRADRNYSPISLPAAPFLVGPELFLPLKSAATAFGWRLTRYEDTGIYLLSKDGRRVRAVVSPQCFRLEIDRSDRWIRVYYAGAFVKEYPACIGAGDNTPVGEFHIQNKGVWPGWRAYWGEYIPGGSPRNPLGARWLGTTARGRATNRVIGIHGTNQPSSIGQRISGGCIRTYNSNAIELYEVIPVGTRLTIHE